MKDPIFKDDWFTKEDRKTMKDTGLGVYVIVYFVATTLAVGGFEWLRSLITG